MNEIICPHCNQAFKIDEAGFADILKQVRNKEFDKELHERLAAAEKDKQSAVKLAEANTKNELQSEVAKKDSELAEVKAQRDAAVNELKAEKDAEIARLQARVESAEIEKKLAVTEAVNKVEKERDEIASKLGVKDHEQKLLETSLKEKHEAELKLKDEQIAQYRDFKAKQSVKLLGESLEQHCEIVFRQWQSAGAFRNVYFKKDNDASSGGKGDYIYRETDEAGNEILSIMFDMKNEADETTAKKKNEDYLKKLDKDRTEKKCQYAVLVSMLEADSELYSGITDVAYAYDRMYVVRPQFFIPIITLLRNGAQDSLKFKAELALVRDQNIDITNFESDLQQFQDGFIKNVKDSSNKFQDAMDGIDVTIKKLESIKEALRLSNKHLLTAGNKVENVSVKRLTKNNPTMAAKFSELKSTEN